MSMVMEKRGVGRKQVRRYEIWEADLGYRERSIQGGKRPVLVISNNIGNKYAPIVIVVPITSKLKKPTQPTHVFFDSNECGMADDSILLCEQIMTINKEENLLRKLFDIPTHYNDEITRALGVSIGMVN
ncbi:mRNA interferase MazF [Paenibacillus amylolyticus]|uniref:mRNA interferase n=1 Tax=Paenibacillus amylolyticus TaxID=1451 RepID=A0AAP5LPT8_PAEAM|nr:type II toxin-antitoxin system PemK/MazF family toxin [Paenibacillus amylolyticus]MDR6725045.1 mRNA interferase MazF [Paenibacillus amylolyticus]